MCARLTERDLVRPTGADGYTFRHILIREVAYSTLSRQTRARLHGAAGRWLAGAPPAGEEALAELFVSLPGGGLNRDRDGARDAVELGDSARDWLVRASQMARSRGAWVPRGATARFGRTSIRTRRRLRPELYELLGDVEDRRLTMIVKYATALDHADRLGRSDDEKLRLLSRAVDDRDALTGIGRFAHDRCAACSPLRGLGGSLLKMTADPLARVMTTRCQFVLSVLDSLRFRARGRKSLAVAERSGSQALELARKLDDANLQSAALEHVGSLAGAPLGSATLNGIRSRTDRDGVSAGAGRIRETRSVSDDQVGGARR